MSFWLREIAGWVLIGIGLYIFYLTFLFCAAHFIFEAPVLAVVGIFVFRGGIHLLKVAIAARLARQGEERLYPLPGASNTPRRG